jgi:anti-sigma regulatory factor (Ser/Thr protein kinase)
VTELRRFDASYATDASVLRSVRRDVMVFLASHGADAECQERACLIVSELASNAIEASADAVFAVQVALDDAAPRATITVTNARRTTDKTVPDRERWGPTTPLARRGRGLAIVDALSDDVRVTLEPHTAAVSAQLRLSST